MNDNAVYPQGGEGEVSLSALFWAVLSKWRTLLVWALVFSLLLGGFKLWRGSAGQSAAPDEELIEESREQLLQLENEIEAYTRELELLRAFLARSLTMNVDANALYTVTNTYYVDADRDASAESVFPSASPRAALAEGYAAGLLGEINVASLVSIGERPGFVGDYDWDGRLLSVDTEKSWSGVFSVRIYGGVKEQAETLATAAEEALASLQPAMEDRFGSHRLVLLGSDRSITADEELADFQDSQWLRLDSLKLAKETAEKRHETVKSSLAWNELGVGTAVKSVLKHALIGAFAGFLLRAGCYALSFLLEDRLLDGESVVQRYGARLLGVHGVGKQETRLDAAIARRRGVAPLCESERSLRRMAANLRAAAKGCDRILLVGSAEQGQMEQLAAQLSAAGELGVPVTVCGDVQAESDAIRALDGTDTVFCVEPLDICRHRYIRGELGTLEALGKRCGGFLLLGRLGR